MAPSAISASRAGESFSRARRRRISGFHSGIFCLRDAIDASDKFVPAAKLRSEDSAVKKGFDCGCTEYMFKPVNEEKLKAVLKKYLG